VVPVAPSSSMTTDRRRAWAPAGLCVLGSAVADGGPSTKALRQGLHIGNLSLPGAANEEAFAPGIYGTPARRWAALPILSSGAIAAAWAILEERSSEVPVAHHPLCLQVMNTRWAQTHPLQLPCGESER